MCLGEKGVGWKFDVKGVFYIEKQFQKERFRGMNERIEQEIFGDGFESLKIF